MFETKTEMKFEVEVFDPEITFPWFALKIVVSDDEKSSMDSRKRFIKD